MSTVSLKEFGWAQSVLAPCAAESVARRVCEELGRSSYPAVRQLTCKCQGNFLKVAGRLPTFHQKQVAISLSLHTVRDEMTIRHEIEVCGNV